MCLLKNVPYEVIHSKLSYDTINDKLENLITRFLVQGKLWFEPFVNFCDVNIPTVADFEISVKSLNAELER
jgi:hypothetical protein